MEKSVKNAVFKGFPVLKESDTFGSKQNSQTTNKETNNSLSSFFRVYYLVSKCMGKRVADQSAIDTALSAPDFFLPLSFCFLPAKIQAFLHLQNFTENIYLFDQVQVV